MITEDYILRMIRDMVKMAAHLAGVGVDPLSAPQLMEMRSAGKTPPLSEQLQTLADRGEINRAENLLFEALDLTKASDFSTALAFYQHINTFSEERLAAADYSREEILEGVKDCAGKFGIDSVLLDGFQGL